MNEQPRKSRLVSAGLTVLLGPLGLFYTTVWGGLAVTALALVTAPTVVGPVIAWLVAIFWGDALARRSRAPRVVVEETSERVVVEETSERVPVATPRTKGRDLNGLLLEGLVWVLVALVVVLWLPDQLGRVEGESALHFYLRWLGGEG